MLSWIMEWIVNNWVFIVILLGIIFWYYFKCHKKIKDREKYIQDLIKSIPLEDKDNVGAVIDKISASLKEDSGNFKKTVGNLWKKYSKNIIKPKDDILPMYTTIEADMYFNMQSLSGNLMLGFFKNLAGVFTGLGILGTFVGLTIGLKGIDTSSNAALQSGISTLLGGTTTAFGTSIVGIVCAIGFNYSHNKLMQSYNKTICELTDSLDELIPYKTMEKLLSEQLDELKDHTDSLKSLSTDIGETINGTMLDIRDALDQSIENNFKPLFDELLTAVQSLNNGGASAIANSFNDMAGQQVLSFAETLQSLESGMKDIMETSRAANEESMKQISNSIKELTEQMNNTIASSIEANNQGMAKNQSMLNQMIETINTSLTNAVSDMTKASEQSNAYFTQTMEKSADKINGMADAITENAQEQAANFSEMSSKLKSTLEDTVSVVQNNLDAHEDRTKQMVLHLERILSSSQGLIEQAGSTADSFARASTPMIQASQQIGGELGKVFKATEDFNKHISDNMSHLNTAITTQQATAQLMNKSVRDINDAFQNMETAWKSYGGHFAETKEGLEDVFGAMNKAVQDYTVMVNRGLSKNLQDYDDSISRVFNRIATINDDLVSSVAELKEAIELQLQRKR